MKVCWFWVLVSMIIALVLLSFSSRRASSSVPDMMLAFHAKSVTMRGTGRKLKEMRYGEKNNEGYVKVEDYHPIDPSPSSKATIKPAPIEHGTPLIPHIPKPSPPPNGG